MITRLLLFIKTFSPAFYALAVLGILWNVRSLWIARRELAASQFQIEREQAEERGGCAISQVILLGQVIALVFLLSTVTYQAYDELNEAKEPPATLAPTQFGTTQPEDRQGVLTIPTRPPEGPQLVRTQPPSPTPAGTLLPADDAVGCIADQAMIETPDNGQVIFEVTSIMGIANIQNFRSYRFEIRNVEQGGDFGVIGGVSSDYTVPIPQVAPLGSIVPQNFAPGEYRFRLTVFDTGGMMRAACEITLFISEPIPTPTPIGGVIAPAFVTATPASQ
jgi:hypothetical protein